MNKLRTALTACLVATAGVSTAVVASTGSSTGAVTAHQTTTPTTLVTAPPIQTKHKKAILLYVDTVIGGGTPKPAATCLEENQFLQGQLVVFRMYGNDASTGGAPLTDANVKSAYITIPGLAPIPMTYRADGTPPVAYWEGTWSTTGYALGTVNFTVTVVTKPARQWGVASLKHSKIPSQTGVFSQTGWATASDLTVVAA